MAAAEKIVEHAKIRRWAEDRGGKPAKVADTAANGGDGVLRFDFGGDDAELVEISWEAFFNIFDRNGLALLEQEETSGGDKSRFAKFVAR